MFSHFDPSGSPHESIVFEDNGKGKVMGVGKVAISNDLFISNVLLVKSSNYNLLSTSQLCEIGYNYFFTNVDVTVIRRDDSSLIFKGQMKGKLYLKVFHQIKLTLKLV